MSSGYVDLRSDTVTKPTAAMRRAMADAEVGDDCYGEDPTVNRLQERVADLLGKQASIYVPTGTMANQVAVRVLSRPGQEVVCESDCHLIHHESGATAILSQVQLRAVRGDGGVLAADAVRDALRADDPFQPSTACVAIENTHNTAGGTVWPIGEARAVAAVARDAGLPVFCDGARLLNACAATGVSAADYAAEADVVTLSLYKGLAAPMGSLVAGSAEVVAAAWTPRRVLGGALRQAGVVAAAGLVALDTMVDRLPEDHERARRLAEGIGAGAPQTNMVLVASTRHAEMLDGLRREGVLAGLIAPGVLRFVTHCDVDDAGVDRAIAAFLTVSRAI